VAVVGFIQLADFCLDCAEARWPVAAGVLVLGILLLMAAARNFGECILETARRGVKARLAQSKVEVRAIPP